MQVSLLSAALLGAAFITIPAKAQQNSRAQMRLYVQQAGPISDDAPDWRDFHNYDFDRFEPGQTAYYANRYYRDERYYKSRVLRGDDRVYRGKDRQYYCRRPDGTTGRITGLVGRIQDEELKHGASGLLGDLIDRDGAVRLRQTVDRGGVTCR